MADAFDIFNYPYAITWVQVTPSYHDEAGTFRAEERVPTVITGHISDVTSSEKQFLPEGVVEAGVKLLSTSTSAIKDGDRIIISDEAGLTKTWYVRKAPYTNNVIQNLTGVSRSNYYITLQK